MKAIQRPTFRKHDIRFLRRRRIRDCSMAVRAGGPYRTAAGHHDGPWLCRDEISRP